MSKHRTGYLFKRGRAFYVRWKINGKVFSKALRDENGDPITNHRDAEDAKTKILAPFVVADETAALESIKAKLQGREAELARLQNEQNPALTIADVWSEYIKSPNRPDSGESTLRQYACQFSAFKTWMREHHAEAPQMRDVTKRIAEEYAAHLIGNGLSPNTYNKHLNLLTLVFRVMKEKARLITNPWTELLRKRLTTHSRRELTLEELKTICRNAEGELRVLLGLGIYSGLRLGDCATLRWNEVDMQRGIIRRVPNKTARRNPKPVIVPIHDVLRDQLSDASSAKRNEYVLPETSAQYLKRVDLVTDSIQRHFKRCGIQLHKPGTGNNGMRAVIEVGFHSLRHSFVSLCRENGAPLSVVESIVGHNSPAMTRHYTHVGELAASRAVAALPSVIGNVAPKLLAPGHEPEALLRKLRELIEAMSSKNWRARQAELLELLPVNGSTNTHASGT